MTAPEDLTVENFGPLLSMVGTWEGHKEWTFRTTTKKKKLVRQLL